MLRNRVIPCLLLDGQRLVKTKKFKEQRYVGDPINAVKIFNEKEVDEIILLDINASKNGIKPNFKFIEEIASECFIPLCYGGGINSVEDARKLFELGVEKVSIQSNTFENLELIKDISERFGSQSVVASIDIKKDMFGRKFPYFTSHKKYQKAELYEFINQRVKAGAGEVLINSIYNDGVMSGMDLKLIASVVKKCPVPIVFMGGVGSLNDIKSAVEHGAQAIAVGSFFVFHGPHKGVLISYPKPETLHKLIG
jgi:cyclase